jgi:signal peptidase II
MQATRGAPVAASADPIAPRRTTSLLVVALLVLAADIVSKVVIVATLRPQQVVRLVGHYLELTNTRNSGAAFSVGTGATVLFTAVALIVVVVILRTAKRLRSMGWAICLGLLLGGALGNLVDRLFRSPAPLRGQVVDWIQLPHWPVFNLADSAIVVGGCIAVLLSTRGITLDGSDGSDGSDASHADGGTSA